MDNFCPERQSRVLREALCTSRCCNPFCKDVTQGYSVPAVNSFITTTLVSSGQKGVLKAGRGAQAGVLVACLEQGQGG